MLPSCGQVHLLIANAGFMGYQGCSTTASTTIQQTNDGHEAHFGAVVLGQYLLVRLLSPALLAACHRREVPRFTARVVFVVDKEYEFLCKRSRKQWDPVDNAQYWLTSYQLYCRACAGLLQIMDKFAHSFSHANVIVCATYPGSTKASLMRKLSLLFSSKRTRSLRPASMSGGGAFTADLAFALSCGDNHHPQHAPAHGAYRDSSRKPIRTPCWVRKDDNVVQTAQWCEALSTKAAMAFGMGALCDVAAYEPPEEPIHIEG